MPDVRVRAMRSVDLPAVFMLQCRAYPAAYHEPVEALASRLAVGAEHCFVAECEGVLAAYVFAHPWLGAPPELHVPLPAVAGADHLFLHDLAVDPGFRGRSAAKALQAAVLASAAARGLAGLRLVAVGAAASFWQCCGFKARADVDLHPAYGAAMAMELPTPLVQPRATASLNA